MGKNPAFQFYPSDWVRDMGPYSLEMCGAWINILCSLFWDGGKQTKTLDEWARILRENRKKTEKIFDFLEKKGIADFERLDNQNVTIISRRMVRDFRITQLRKEVGKLGGNPNLKKTSPALLNQTDNQKPTPSSSSSSSSSISSKNKHIECPVGIKEETWTAFLEMRKSMKAPLTEYSAKLIVDKLAKLSPGNGDGMELILQQTIANNWKGVFPLKDGNYGTGDIGRTGQVAKKAGSASSDGSAYPVDAEC